MLLTFKDNVTNLQQLGGECLQDSASFANPNFKNLFSQTFTKGFTETDSVFSNKPDQRLKSMNTEQLWTLLDKYKSLKESKHEQSTKSRILDLQADVIREVQT